MIGDIRAKNLQEDLWMNAGQGGKQLRNNP